MKKFFLIGAIKFFVILALTLTRDNKDTMVVTECGAEAIAFLKVSVRGYLFVCVFHKIMLCDVFGIVSSQLYPLCKP